MNELDGDGAFPDRSGDALDRSVSDVSDRENAGHAGFEGERRAFERPLGRSEVVAGAEESVLVPSHLLGEKLRLRTGSDEYEERIRRDSRPFARDALAQLEFPEVAFASAPDDLGSDAHLDP